MQPALPASSFQLDSRYICGMNLIILPSPSPTHPFLFSSFQQLKNQGMPPVIDLSSQRYFTHSTPTSPTSPSFLLLLLPNPQGHACPVLYAAWCEAGLLSKEHILTLRKPDSLLEGHPTPVSSIHYTHILYSRKLSWVKTFANFAVLPASAKALSTNFSARGLGERVGFSKTRKFYLRNALLYQIREGFHPRKFPAIRYLLHTTNLFVTTYYQPICMYVIRCYRQDKGNNTQNNFIC